MILKLVVFSICTQAAIGTIVLVMIAENKSKENNFDAAMIMSAILSAIGFSAFLLYLGTPTFVFNALSQISHSWLSREILFTGTFIGLAIINVVTLYVNPQVKRFGWAASVIGVINIVVMVNVCRNTSVTTWKSMAVYADFFATSIILGIVALFVTSFVRLGSQRQVYSVIGLLAVAIQTATSIYYGISFNSEPDSMVLMTQCLLLIGGALLFLPQIKNWAKNSKLSRLSNYISIASLIAGLVVNRYLFYAFFMAAKGLS